MACQHLAIEHAQSIIFLIDQGYHGSALALQRPMFEAIVRGVWLRYTATNTQLDQAAAGTFPCVEDMVRSSPRRSDQNETPPLKALKDSWWRRLCGYTHGGAEQILPRLGSGGLRAEYQRDEVVGALRWSDIIQLYSGVEMVDASGNEALAQEFLNRMNCLEQICET